MNEQSTDEKRLPWPVIIMLSMLAFVIGLGFLLSPSSEQDKLWWVNLLGTTNYGTLLNPPVEIESEQLIELEYGPWAALAHPTFKLVVTNQGDCAEACQEMLYSVRQLHVRLNRDYEDVERGLLLVDQFDQDQTEQVMLKLPDTALLTPSSSELLESLTATNMPSLEDGPVLVMIDPSNLAMMTYTSEHTGSEILEDLEHLLELAR